MTIPNAHALFDRWCDDVARRYLGQYPEEEFALRPLKNSLYSGVDLSSRHTFPLHLTGSAVVIDFAATHILLLNHRELRLWLQPGGHLELGEYPPQAARRELNEESAVTDVECEEVEPLPLDIDIHRIPENADKGEPEHLHCDFCYLFRAERANIFISDESVSARWVRRGDELFELTGGRFARLSLKLDRLYPN